MEYLQLELNETEEQIHKFRRFICQMDKNHNKTTNTSYSKLYMKQKNIEELAQLTARRDGIYEQIH